MLSDRGRSHRANLKTLCSAGFDVHPFETWEQSQTYIKKCAKIEFAEKKVILMTSHQQKQSVYDGYLKLKPVSVQLKFERMIIWHLSNGSDK